MSRRRRHAPAGRVAGRASVRGLRHSAIALGIAALLGGNVDAQQPASGADPVTDDATELDAVVVTGVRSSVTQAQAIKPDAEQIVDSIVAEDIGKLPDNNIAVPHGAGINTTNGERDRETSAIAMQWRPNDDVEVYLQALRSDYTFSWLDYSFFAYSGDSPMLPVPGGSFVVNDRRSGITLRARL